MNLCGLEDEARSVSRHTGCKSISASPPDVAAGDHVESGGDGDRWLFQMEVAAGDQDWGALPHALRSGAVSVTVECVCATWSLAYPDRSCGFACLLFTLDALWMVAVSWWALGSR